MKSTTERSHSNHQDEDEPQVIKTPGTMTIEELLQRQQELEFRMEDMEEAYNYALRLTSMYSDMRTQLARVESTLEERRSGVDGYGKRLKGNRDPSPEGEGE